MGHWEIASAGPAGGTGYTDPSSFCNLMRGRALYILQSTDTSVDLTEPPQQPNEVGRAGVWGPASQRRKSRLKKVKQLGQSHVARSGQS